MDKGAHFHRCDFQVHTPRDGAWKGPRPVDDTGRKAYAVEFVAACRERGLAAVAITDHHDLTFFPFIRAAALEEKYQDGSAVVDEDRLVVFPGIELTLGVPCQALLLLDPDFPEAQLPAVLIALGAEVIDPKLDRLPDVISLDSISSLKQLHETLDARAQLRGRYIVFPNVTDSGHKTLLRKSMQAKYKEMPCVGGYVDGALKLGTGNQNIVRGLDPNWGRKRIAVFQTSDSRSISFDLLGRHTTWVKWAEPSAEALRQACLAPESRISQVDPILPTIHITQCTVSDSRFMSRFSIELNAQYNAIIGGRGTGKSTILEYVRWALCDQELASDEAEVADHQIRQQRLIQQTLRPYNATVEVKISRNGVEHTVVRNSVNDSIYLTIANGAPERISEAQLRAVLPIQGYSQKQLSTVSSRMDEISRFVTAPLQGQLESNRASMDDLAAQIRRNFAKLQQKRQLTTELAKSRIRRDSLSGQVALLRTSLVAVTEDSKAIIDAKAIFDETKSAIEHYMRQVERLRGAAKEFARLVEDVGVQITPRPANSQFADVVADVHSQATILTSLARMHAEAATTELQVHTDSQPGYDTALAQWITRKESFEQSYEIAKGESSVQESRLKELTDLEDALTMLDSATALQRAARDSLGDPAVEHVQLREEWLRVQDLRTEYLREQCSAIEILSKGLLRATLAEGAGVHVLIEKVKAIVAGTGLRSAKVEGLVNAVAASESPRTSMEEILMELERYVGVDFDGDVLPQTLSLLEKYGLSVSDVRKIIDRLSPEAWLELALTPLDDEPRFEFRTREGEHISFESASPGQQATALLRVLLSQDGPPLLIDQPEDDLDSEVIQEIVTDIWRAKASRQLLFSSHNANLVVNGDAELVICCGYKSAADQSAGSIKRQGAIDVAAVRDDITRVMEGGEGAFRLRKEKYGF